MATDDANDVAKALAAFGAPSIRYHSFGQSQVRPSPIVPPPRDTIAAAIAPVFAPAPIANPPVVQPPDLPGERELGPLLQQEEPEAAPETVPGLVPVELRAVDAGPAWARPVKTDGLAAPQPGTVSATVPSPPRPLAEWAPPMAAMPPPNQVAPMMTPPRAKAAGNAMPPAPPSVPVPTMIAAPVPPVPPAPPPPHFAKPAPEPVLQTTPAVIPEAASPPSSVGALAGNASTRSLTEIFALLASGQGNAAATGRAAAEMFRRG